MTSTKTIKVNKSAENAINLLTKLRDGLIEPVATKEEIKDLIWEENNLKVKYFLQQCLYLARLYERRATATERQKADSLIQRLANLQTSIKQLPV